MCVERMNIFHGKILGLGFRIPLITVRQVLVVVMRVNIIKIFSSVRSFSLMESVGGKFSCTYHLQRGRQFNGLWLTLVGNAYRGVTEMNLLAHCSCTHILPLFSFMKTTL